MFSESKLHQKQVLQYACKNYRVILKKKHSKAIFYIFLLFCQNFD